MGLSKETLLCKLPQNYRRPLSLVQASSAIIIPSLPNSDSSEVTMSLGQIVTMFDSVCTELWRRVLASLFYSDSSIRPPALARPVFNVSSPSSDAEDHQVYFIVIAR
ncbi:hypothetical protein Acr_18g0007700 [Actinidia rufa]|uniref:Uncharacterized protein n=1 Tax=Actinidia rufa TaxID=165716 RepID=A0A7J0G728_9ERIC|nr:hypothetical protein Acr_18g0007700 [Actinidia rufa]